jgi:RNA polymerase sigma-70 factor (ECF subfamily)
VVLRTDGGGTGPLARPPVVGAVGVAQQARLFGSRFVALGRQVVVNGGPGVVISIPGQPTIVAGFTVAGGLIVEIDLIADPHKLGGMPS